MVQCVWFKRDLRLHDHAPLSQALTYGPTICLYVIEPELWRGEEWDIRHSLFIQQSIAELREDCRNRGGEVYIRIGNFPDVLENFHQESGFTRLWSYEETGNQYTYHRDLRVKAWCQSKGLTWHETPQGGVVRRLKSRDTWTKHWQSRMKSPIHEAPKKLYQLADLPSGDWPNVEQLGLQHNQQLICQAGGKSSAMSTLHSFLYSRGQPYQKAMSSPITAWNSCSRLSPYLAWGNVSLKQVVHATQSRIQELKSNKQQAPKDSLPDINLWLRSLKSFEKRLHWRDHFMQKLEDEPDIEFYNFNRGMDGLRENDWNDDYFQAWANGQTGYPLIDACMRCLHTTGWINFRMRAMLMSFASYQLWLHWRPTALHLAKLFLDFEPGIHYSQAQMQSGTTGINTIRMYSPIKQVKDQDPEGVFIREWLPELANVPNEYLAEPHTMPIMLQSMVGCIIGKNYPAPIVEHTTAYKAAQQKIYAAKNLPDVRQAANQVYEKHGSRKRLRTSSTKQT